MGHVIQAGAGQITARQAAVKGGIPMDVPALTVNKVCLSGLNAIAMADQLISVGEFDVVVAGGMESMTNGPYLLPGAGRATATATTRSSMRPRTTRCTARSTCAGWATRPTSTPSRGSSTREEQDAYSAQSHERATHRAARTACSTTRSSPWTVPQRRGDPLTVTETRASARHHRRESWRKLRPAFSADGTVTAGSARRSPTAPRRWW